MIAPRELAAAPSPEPARAVAPSRRVADLSALALLLALYVLFVARSWLAWGHLDVDYGREMYVPLRLAAGDVIYRDIRYPYGPLSPYLHAFAYWLWKPHLNVLYASGLVSTALLVATLYAIGRQLAPVGSALLAAALVMVDLMFIPGSLGSFSYIFPYAFPALHGTLFMSIALAGALRVIDGGGVAAAALSGTGIGLALLTKVEFGLVSLGIGLSAIFGLFLRGRRRDTSALVAAITLPALGLPVLGYGALASVMPGRTIVAKGLFAPEYFEASHKIAWTIAGVPEGLSPAGIAMYLARLYWRCGWWYLAQAGVISAIALAAGITRTRFGWSRSAAWAAGLLTAVAAASWAVTHGWWNTLRSFLDWRYGALPALCALWLVVETWTVWRRRSPSSLQRWITLAVALGLLLRVPGRAVPFGYANFYLAPAIVLAVHLLLDLLPRGLAALDGSRVVARALGIVLVCALGLRIGVTRYTAWTTREGLFPTPRGNMRLSVSDEYVPGYWQAMQLINGQTPPGATVLAIPCETALYFLTGRGNHYYETGLVAVVLTEAAERAYIAELERDPPAMVLVSNRPQFEYGRSFVGIGFNRSIADWIQQHYRFDRIIGGSFFRIAVWRPR